MTFKMKIFRLNTASNRGRLLFERRNTVLIAASKIEFLNKICQNTRKPHLQSGKSINALDNDLMKMLQVNPLYKMLFCVFFPGI